METTRKILGIPDNEDIALFVGAIFNSNPEEGLKIARRLYEDGSDLSEFCLKITGMIRKVILFLAAGESVLYDTAEDLDKIKALAKQTTLLELTKIIDLFISANQLMKDVDYPMLPLEIAIIKASQISPVTAKPAVIKAESPVVSGKAAHGKDEKNDSAEKAVVPTKSAAVPVPVMEMTKDIWSQVIELTKKGNSTLAALLRDAKPEQVTDDTVIIGVKFKFHKDRISEPKNCQALEKVISEVMGQTYKVICKISESKNNILKKDIPENLEEAVAEVFEL